MGVRLGGHHLAQVGRRIGRIGTVAAGVGVGVEHRLRAAVAEQLAQPVELVFLHRGMAVRDTLDGRLLFLRVAEQCLALHL